MKLAIAAFGTALVLASGASAMVGPYERAVNDAEAASSLITTGERAYDEANTVSTSPQAEWNNGEDNTVTVFPASGDAGTTGHYGANAR